MLAKRYHVARLDAAFDPSGLITFASSRFRVATQDTEGYLWVSQPPLDSTFDEREDTSSTARAFGNVHPRYASKAAIGWLDGYAGLIDEAGLLDRGNWANRAQLEAAPRWEPRPSRPGRRCNPLMATPSTTTAGTRATDGSTAMPVWSASPSPWTPKCSARSRPRSSMRSARPGDGDRAWRRFASIPGTESTAIDVRRRHGRPPFVDRDGLAGMLRGRHRAGRSREIGSFDSGLPELHPHAHRRRVTRLRRVALASLGSTPVARATATAPGRASRVLPVPPVRTPTRPSDRSRGGAPHVPERTTRPRNRTARDACRSVDW